MSQKLPNAAASLRAANKALKSGQYAKAEGIYKEVLARFPANIKAKSGLQTAKRIQQGKIALGDTPEQLHVRGRRAEEQGDLSTAISLYRQVLSVRPDFLDVQNDLGLALLAAGKTAEAIKVLKDLVSKVPKIAEAYINLAKAQTESGDYDAAISSCERALARAPNHPVALCNLGSICARLGNLERAEESFQTCIEHHPMHADAFANLAQLRRVQHDDAIIGQMEAALVKTELSAGNAVSLNFSLGKAHTDVGNYQKAFEHYKLANSGAVRTRHLQPDTQLTFLEGLRTSYEHGDIPMLSAAEAAPGPFRPIFVVGMPRSGSTLIERVLAAHSQVQEAGEIDSLPMAIGAQRPQKGAKSFLPSKDLLHKIRDGYFDRVKSLANGKPNLVDKNLLNFQNVGVICAAFPEAIILHMKREPMAVCWSCFTQNFRSETFSFTFDLDVLGRYYRDYLTAMAFWHQMFPNRVADISYDAFTEDPDDQTKVLLDTCSLPFEEACLYSEKNQGAVTTASVYQVRNKVYKGSSRNWEPFRSFVTPALAKYID